MDNLTHDSWISLIVEMIIYGRQVWSTSKIPNKFRRTALWVRARDTHHLKETFSIKTPLHNMQKKDDLHSGKFLRQGSSVEFDWKHDERQLLLHLYRSCHQGEPSKELKLDFRSRLRNLSHLRKTKPLHLISRTANDKNMHVPFTVPALLRFD